MPKYKFTEIAINSTEKKKPTEADKDTYIGGHSFPKGYFTVAVLNYGKAIITKLLYAGAECNQAMADMKEITEQGKSLPTAEKYLREGKKLDALRFVF